MKKLLALIVIIILTTAPIIFGAIRNDTSPFTDETPGKNDYVGTFSLTPAQFSFNNYVGHVMLRMGGRVRVFNWFTTSEEWTWPQLTVTTPLNPKSIDSIDFEGTGSLNDVAYISSGQGVTVREGNSLSKSDIHWKYEFDDEVFSLEATDYDGDGKLDDLIVLSGQRIFIFKPSEDEDPINSFVVNEFPRIIGSVDTNSDGKMDDVVVGSWAIATNQDEEQEISDGKITLYGSTGNRKWSFPQTPLDQKPIYIKAYDRDSDGFDDDLIVLFTNDINQDDPETDLYIVSGGSQVYFSSNVKGTSPADFDGDGKLDDLILLTETQIFALDSGESGSQPSVIEGKTKTEFNFTVDGQIPLKFLGVTSLSFEPIEGINVFDDAAIFVTKNDDERGIFFIENLATEVTSTTTTTPTTTTTTTLTPQAPSAKITGISDGDLLEEEKTYPVTASASEDPDGEIVSYRWFIDDILKVSGSDKIDFTLNTQGLSSGAHTIKLEVTDDDGMKNQDSKTISIKMGNLPPIANAGADLTVLEGTLVSISSDASSDPDGEIKFVEWSEDGSIFSTKKVEENLTFPVGVHTLTLKVTDEGGASSTDTVVITVEIENIPPNADAGEDATVIEGTSVHFSAENSSDVDGIITSFVWSLPDGKVVKTATFDAKFPTGTHKIILNVTDNKGAVGTDEITITVNKLPTTYERIRIEYGSSIQISVLTLVALIFATIIFLRKRSKSKLY
jgi:hypothetical protein